MTITADDAREMLLYDPETGKLFWRHRSPAFFKSGADCLAWNVRYSGAEAFTATSSHGYKVGKILGRSQRAHRIIWLIVHGAWPVFEVDHINGFRWDNRLENLRDVTRAENNRNTSQQANNSSGVNGVSWSEVQKKWRAFIKVGRRTKFLGYFQNIKDAAKARMDANMEYGFSNRHGASLVSSSRNGSRPELDVRSPEEPRSFGRRLVIRSHRKAEGGEGA